jgi:hypothetical protein
MVENFDFTDLFQIDADIHGFGHLSPLSTGSMLSLLLLLENHIKTNATCQETSRS